MIDPTPNEMQAMTVGGQHGGEFLENIGKSDLATLTETEWDRFLDAVVTGYCVTTCARWRVKTAHGSTP